MGNFLKLPLKGNELGSSWEEKVWLKIGPPLEGGAMAIRSTLRFEGLFFKYSFESIQMTHFDWNERKCSVKQFFKAQFLTCSKGEGESVLCEGTFEFTQLAM